MGDSSWIKLVGHGVSRRQRDWKPEKPASVFYPSECMCHVPAICSMHCVWDSSGSHAHHVCSLYILGSTGLVLEAFRIGELFLRAVAPVLVSSFSVWSEADGGNKSVTSTSTDRRARVGKRRSAPVLGIQRPGVPGVTPAAQGAIIC